MKTYKTIDYYGNFVLLVAIVSYAAIMQQVIYLLAFYPIFCIWHLQSMIVNAFVIHKFVSSTSRRLFTRISFLFLAVFACFYYLSFNFFTNENFVIGGLYCIVILLLLVSPIMAVSYVLMCHSEIKKITNRPISFLK